MSMLSILSAPTDEEAAAIVAAVEALWPRPMVMMASERAPDPMVWRFSARWWGGPSAAARQRPWLG